MTQPATTAQREYLRSLYKDMPLNAAIGQTLDDYLRMAYGPRGIAELDRDGVSAEIDRILADRARSARILRWMDEHADWYAQHGDDL